MYVCREFPGVGIPLQLPNDLGVGQCEKMEGVGVVSIGQCDPNSNFAPVLKCAIVKLAVVVRSLNLLRGSDKKK